MSDSANRIAVQEGYVLPFQAYRSGSRRTKSAARRVDPEYGVGYHKTTRERVRVSRRGHGPKSAAFTNQQSKMKRCAAAWKSALRNAGARRGGVGAYRKHMAACLKRRD